MSTWALRKQDHETNDAWRTTTQIQETLQLWDRLVTVHVSSDLATAPRILGTQAKRISLLHSDPWIDQPREIEGSICHKSEGSGILPSKLIDAFLVKIPILVLANPPGLLSQSPDTELTAEGSEGSEESLRLKVTTGTFWQKQPRTVTNKNKQPVSSFEKPPFLPAGFVCKQPFLASAESLTLAQRTQLSMNLFGHDEKLFAREWHV